MGALVNKPIGVFDSGVGGLTVVKEILRTLPSEGIIYLGDTARVPYGIRTKETVVRYTFEGLEFLLKKDIKLLVIACNTASAMSLKEVSRESPVPIIGVIEPGARAAISVSKNKHIGVIGTEATIKSKSYIRALRALDPEVKVFSRACPLFVPLVEEGWTEGEIAHLTASKYLEVFNGKGIDTMLLGCTHYPLLKGTIEGVLGNGITLIDSAIETAKEVKGVLSKMGIGAGKMKTPLREFYVTDGPERFREIGEKFLGQDIENIKLIRL